jgi:hypothetical protein
MSRDPSHPARSDHIGFPGPAAPLEAVRVSWEWLCAAPHPVTVDGRVIEGLPDQLIPLDELRARLLARGCPPAVRDAVWAHLVRRSRAEGGTWTVAAAGMALPVLTRVARILTAKYAGDPTDIHAAVLSGFLTGLTRVDPERPAVLVSLRWAAYRGGLAAVREALRAPVPVGDHGFESTPPRPAARHPDLVLARAVAERVISHDEAALIGSTRLEHVRLADAATARGQTYHAANAVRHRAERRLLAYLSTPDTEPAAVPDPVLDTVLDNLPLASSPARRSATQPGVRRPERGTRLADVSAASTGRAVSEQGEPEPASAPAAHPTRRRRTRNATRHRSHSVTSAAGVSRGSSGAGTDISRPASHTLAAPDLSEPDHTRAANSASGRVASSRGSAAAQTRQRGAPATPGSGDPLLLRSGDVLSESGLGQGVPLRGGSHAATAPTATGDDSRDSAGDPATRAQNARPGDTAAPAGDAPSRAASGRQHRGRGRRGRRRVTRPATSTGDTASGLGGSVTESRPVAEPIRPAPAPIDPRPRASAETCPPGEASSDEKPAAPGPKPEPGLTGGAAEASAGGAAAGKVRGLGRRVRRLAVLLVVVGGLCVASAPVSAQALARASAQEAGVVVLAQAESIDQVLSNIRGWLMGILAGLATVMATVGGIRYVIADGDPGEIQRAKTAFRSAGIGFALAALAPLLVTILQGLVGL